MKRPTTCAKIVSKFEDFEFFSGFFKLSTFRSRFRTIGSLGFLDTTLFYKCSLIVMFLLATVCEAQLRLCVVFLSVKSILFSYWVATFAKHSFASVSKFWMKRNNHFRSEVFKLPRRFPGKLHVSLCWLNSSLRKWSSPSDLVIDFYIIGVTIQLSWDNRLKSCAKSEPCDLMGRASNDLYS